MAYIQGIDCSSVQGYNINWNAVKTSGIDFLIQKCYEGNSGLDPTFSSNIAGAKAAGIYTACYCVVYPLPTDSAHPNRDPVDQANLHYNASEGEIICVDCEFPAPQDWSKWGINSSFINQWLMAYMTELSSKTTPRSPIIYSYPDYIKALNLSPSFGFYPYWAASYGTASPLIPAPFTDWVLWQYGGGTWHLPSGAPCDANYAKDLSIWNV